MTCITNLSGVPFDGQGLACDALQILQNPAAFPGIVMLAALAGAVVFATITSRWL